LPQDDLVLTSVKSNGRVIALVSQSATRKGFDINRSSSRI
jgi:hypothetical protein